MIRAWDDDGLLISVSASVCLRDLPSEHFVTCNSSSCVECDEALLQGYKRGGWGPSVCTLHLEPLSLLTPVGAPRVVILEDIVVVD